jgi:hypothetical protein
MQKPTSLGSRLKAERVHWYSKTEGRLRSGCGPSTRNLHFTLVDKEQPFAAAIKCDDRDVRKPDSRTLALFVS